MNKIYLRYFQCLLLLFLILINSCKEIKDQKSSSHNIYKVEQFGDCKINTERLKLIFDENIEDEIECLHESFKQIEKYVKRQHESYLDKNEVTKFVQNYFKNDPQAIRDGLYLIFTIESLFFRQTKNRLYINDISPLFNLIKLTNKILVEFKSTWESTDSYNFITNREKIRHLIINFTQQTLPIIKKGTGNPSYDLIELYHDIQGQTELKTLSIDNFTKLLPIKLLLVGGDKNILNSFQLEEILEKLTDIGLFIFDINFSNIIDFKNENAKWSFFYEQYLALKNISKDNLPDDQLIYSIDDLIYLFKKYTTLNEDFDLDCYKKAIQKAKQIFVGGDDNTIYFKDFLSLLNVTRDFISRIYYNSISFYKNEDTIRTPGPISSLPTIHMLEFNIFENELVPILGREFGESVVNHHFYRDDSGVQHFDTKIKRELYGINEISLIKYAFYNIFPYYGVNADIETGISTGASIEQVKGVLLDFRKPLIELKLWPMNLDTSVDNIYLLTDLFQYRSNGNGALEIEELTEFVEILITSTYVGDKLLDKMKYYCKNLPVSGEDYGFKVKCMRKHFFKILFDDLKYNEHFTTLYNFWKNNSKQVTRDFIKDIEKFARDYLSEKIPVRQREFYMLFGAMLTIESTLIRFDKNKDDIIDYDELLKAYPVYIDSIAKLGDLNQEDINEYGKAIFFYLIKNKEVPSTSLTDRMVVWYYSFTHVQKKIFADRSSIASLFGILSTND